ncbi:hypothetical protein L8106_07481 [Lyngbya sp. PCC 8106]|nr:hypothetical protein L8106_07481 [Lyngbya sp. PCC 8106]
MTVVSAFFQALSQVKLKVIPSTITFFTTNDTRFPDIHKLELLILDHLIT